MTEVDNHGEARKLTREGTLPCVRCGPSRRWRCRTVRVSSERGCRGPLGETRPRDLGAPNGPGVLTVLSRIPRVEGGEVGLETRSLSRVRTEVRNSFQIYVVHINGQTILPFLGSLTTHLQSYVSKVFTETRKSPVGVPGYLEHLRVRSDPHSEGLVRGRRDSPYPWSERP